MKTRSIVRLSRPKFLVLALVSAGTFVHAEEPDERQKLTTPDSVVTAGVGNVNRDNGRFGQYLGLHERGSFGIFDVLYSSRDDTPGTWLRLDARNLGLTSREFLLEHGRQGNWGVWVQWNETPRASQYVVNTRLAGIGTGTQSVNGEAAFRDVRLDTLRQAVTAGVEKSLGNGFDAQVRVRSEDKSGSRIFGRSSGDFLAEPIDSTISQLDATVGFTGKTYQWNAGYVGSRYDNHVLGLTATGGAGAAFSPIALPPGNEGHQIFVSGSYLFSPTTRGHAKIAWGRFTQGDDYIAAPAATPNLTGKTRLDGKLMTKLISASLSTRPIPAFSINANIRLEDRDDRTPSVRYGAAPAAGSTFDGLYEPRSISTRFARLEGTYRLPAGVSMVAGFEQDNKERFVPSGPVVTVAAREKTEEGTWKLEVRRAMSETLNGTVAYYTSKRDGSPLLTSVGFISGLPTSNLVAPFHVADRERDRRKIALDWTPSEALSFQLVADDSDDDYSGRPMGLKSGKSRNVSLDATMALTESWQLTAWASHNKSTGTQISQTCTANVANVCTVVGQIWSASLGNKGSAGGFAVRGQTKSGIELGLEINRTKDRSSFDMAAVYPTGVTPPPASDYSLNRVKLSARVPFDKRISVRTEVGHDRWTTDDWTWSNFVYADGTRVLQNPRQGTSFLAVAVQYRF